MGREDTERVAPAGQGCRHRAMSMAVFLTLLLAMLVSDDLETSPCPGEPAQRTPGFTHHARWERTSGWKGQAKPQASHGAGSGRPSDQDSAQGDSSGGSRG